MPKNTTKDDAAPGNAYPGTLATRKLAELHRNPRQDENFHPLSDEELDQLANDMMKNGQRDAIEILPDGRIIDGHQRYRAAKKNGWSEVSVRVRHDLAGDEAAIERRMIEANLVRRQLDPLDRVRLAQRMMEIDRKTKPGGLSQFARQDLRDKIGRKLGMSGRNVQRYMNILNAPMEVQRAYSGGKLSMKLAEKVAQMAVKERTEIAAEITAGNDPERVVLAHLPKAAPAPINPDKEYEVFLGAVTRAVEVLDDRVEEVRGGWDLDPEIETLKKAGTLITRIIRRHRTRKKDRVEALRGLKSINF